MVNGTLPDVAPPGLPTPPRLYDSDDWRAFFGRDSEARSVAQLWSDKRLIILYGEPGIGKTSLIRAGVVPLVRRPNTDLLSTGSLTYKSPFSAAPLFEHNPFTLALLSSWAPLETPVLLSTMTVSSFLQRNERMTGASTVLAVVDQAENLFRGSEAMQRYRKQFLDDLAEALHDHPGLHIVIVIRDSQLHALLSDNLPVPDAQVQLQGLEPEAAVSAVRHTVADTGSFFAPGVADALAEKLIGELLNAQIADSHGNQVTLRENRVHPAFLRVVTGRLQRSLSPGMMITKGRLQNFLDVDGWLAEFICQSIVNVSRYHERDPSKLCSWLAQTFLTAEGLTVAVNDMHGVTAGMPTPILLALEDHYILRSELRSGSRYFELQSVRLIKPLQLADQMLLAFIRAASPSSFADHLEDAATAFSRRDLELAERHAQRALQFSSEVGRTDHARVETLLGNIDYQLDDTDQARHHYLNSAKLFEATQNQLAVGRLLAAIGRLSLLESDAATAIRMLRSALSRAPNDDYVRMELARAFAASGEGVAAVALLEAVLTSEDDRDVGEAYLLRGEIRADLGDAGALSDLERVPRAETASASARAARAVTLARLGRFADAEEGIKQAIHMASDSGLVLLRAAQIRALRGDDREAARLARRAIKATVTPLTQHQRRLADELQEKRHR